MSQIKKSQAPKQLFKYHLENNLANDARQSMYFIRLNRFRFNSYNKSSIFKYLKLKYPLMIALVASIAFDYRYRFYVPVPVEH